MSGNLHAIWVLAVTLLFVFAGEARAMSGTGAVRVGTAAVDITPPVGVPLAGYGGPERRMFPDLWNREKFATWLKPSTGKHDPIRAKAFVLRNSERTALFLSLDLIGVDDAFYRVIKAHARKAGITDVFIGATHTHSGPGALSKSWIYEIIAADRFLPSVYEQVLTGTREAIDRALLDLEPARLYRSKFTIEGLQKNRRHRDGHFDPDARMLFARNESGRVLGGIVNFAIHPIALGESNHLYTADIAGGIERKVREALDSQGEILFWNGATGDVSTQAHGFDEVEAASLRFAAVARAAVEGAVPMEGIWEVRSNRVSLPKAGIALSACDPKLLGKIFGKKARFPVGRKALPPVAEVQEMEFADGTLLLSWPGEATTDLGFELRARAKERGFPDAWNLGLTNGYVGYFVTAEEFAAGGYEVCVAYHGPDAGKRILEAHQTLLDSNPRTQSNLTR